MGEFDQEAKKRIRSMLAKFESDFDEIYRAYDKKEDGNGGVILMHKTSKLIIHVKSPWPGLFYYNGGTAIENQRTRMLRDMRP